MKLNNPLSLSTLSFANMPTGGALGTAAATVDIAASFSISQTTTGQSILLPDPTNTVPSKILVIHNSGSASFNLEGVTINPGNFAIFFWRTDSWLLQGSSAIKAPTVWAPSTAYYIGDLLYTDGTRVVMRISNGTSGATTFGSPESDEYIVISPITVISFSANTWYYYGEQIEENGLIYMRILAGTSTASWSAAERANWRIVGTADTPVNTTGQTKTGNYTVIATDGILLLSPAGATQTITLPSTLNDGKKFGFMWTVDTSKVITFTQSWGAQIVSPFTDIAVTSWTTADNGGLVNGSQVYISYTKANGIFQYSI